MAKLSGYEANRLLKKESKRRKGIQPVLESGVDVKTINGETIVGPGNLDVAGGGGYAEGTSFPGSPTTNQKFYRTDLNWLCFYDGTRWLTCQEFAQDFPAPGAGSSVTAAIARNAVRKDYYQYFTKAAITSRILGATNNGSNYWTFSIDLLSVTGGVTSIASANTSADTANQQTNRTIIVNYESTSSFFSAETVVTKVGSPSNILLMATLYYRLIVT